MKTLLPTLIALAFMTANTPAQNQVAAPQPSTLNPQPAVATNRVLELDSNGYFEWACDAKVTNS